MAHVARRFERFLEVHHRPDGGRWTGAELERATVGAMHRSSYVTNVRKATIASPGYEKLDAIAKATAKEMGFPPSCGSKRIRPPPTEEPLRHAVGSRAEWSACSKLAGH